MPRVCHFTGKHTTFGNQITHRGKAKYLGGVGTKSRASPPAVSSEHSESSRLIDGRICRIKVSAKAIKMGLIAKPVKRKVASGAGRRSLGIVNNSSTRAEIEIQEPTTLMSWVFCNEIWTFDHK